MCKCKCVEGKEGCVGVGLCRRGGVESSSLHRPCPWVPHECQKASPPTNRFALYVDGWLVCVRAYMMVVGGGF